MMHWFFSAIVILSSVVATGAKNTRTAVLALWVCGLGVGAIFITLGTELLAIVQWILSTVVAISFVFFSVTFGEYQGPQNGSRPVERSSRSRILLLGGIVIGLAFAAIVWLGLGATPEALLVLPPDGNDLASLGKKLIFENFLSVQLIGLTLLVALIGGGAVARPLSKFENDSSEATKEVE